MRCWRVRWSMSDLIEDTLSEPMLRQVRKHLDSCVRCREQIDSLTSVASLVKDSGQNFARPIEDPDGPSAFEDRLMRAIWSRALKVPVRDRNPLQNLRRPVPLGAAVIVLAAILLLGFYFGGMVVTDGFAPRLTVTDRQDPTSKPPELTAGLEVTDPPEVPFLLRQDLVGTRRGRIPLTTYVLEPAPEDDAVLRASY